MSKKGTSKGTIITVETLEEMKRKLSNMPIKQSLDKKNAVLYLRDVIHSLIEKNYSTEEISQLLKKEGLTIAPAVLGKYLKEMNKGNNKRNQTKEPPGEMGGSKQGGGKKEKEAGKPNTTNFNIEDDTENL